MEYSMKMRASAEGKHISGAEKIVVEKDIHFIAQQMATRALTHLKGKPDEITISVKKLRYPPKEIDCLPITLHKAENNEEAKGIAQKLLSGIGIHESMFEKAFHMMLNLKGMRGAILVDVHYLERIDSLDSRGVRVTNFDFTHNIVDNLDTELTKYGLHMKYTKEALCLGSKVAFTPGILGEICWSDDPGYQAGCISSSAFGYHRIPFLKPTISGDGGRIFFVDGSKANIGEIVRYLQEEAVLISGIPVITEAKYV